MTRINEESFCLHLIDAISLSQHWWDIALLMPFTCAELLIGNQHTHEPHTNALYTLKVNQSNTIILHLSYQILWIC